MAKREVLDVAATVGDDLPDGDAKLRWRAGKDGGIDPVAHVLMDRKK